MFIQTEQTPNPSTLKFIPGCEVVGNGNVEFKKTEDYSNSPLAEVLFRIDGVEKLFFGPDFISITKSEDKTWLELKTISLETIMEHFTMGGDVMVGEEDNIQEISLDNYSDTDQEIVKQILEIIETRVKPAVANDGGDIVFDHFEEGIVYLEMKGACAGCPSSTVTLKSGIENLLKHFVPEVIEVRQAF